VDWHAAPDSCISDAELMRATVNATRRIQGLLDVGSSERPKGTLGSRQAAYPDSETLAPVARMGASAGVPDAVALMLTAPDRRLPDGQLREVAPSPGQLAAYSHHVHNLAGQWAALADHVGMSAVLPLLASYAAVSCRRWWLGLDWPYLVTEFVARLHAPGRWGDAAIAAHVQGLTRPRQATDLDQLQELLLTGPDRLSSDAARYCLRGAGPDGPAISAPPTSEPLLLTVGQAAQRLGISRSLLYELLATDEIESITIRRLRRIPAVALTTYIQLQRAKNQGQHRT
jgi:excisionase family DNA binding protein